MNLGYTRDALLSKLEQYLKDYPDIQREVEVTGCDSQEDVMDIDIALVAEYK